jgi:hypothetical protein
MLRAPAWAMALQQASHRASWGSHRAGVCCPGQRGGPQQAAPLGLRPVRQKAPRRAETPPSWHEHRGENLDGRAAARAVVAEAERQGARICAFFCESLLSCGGQVVLPPGYLQAVYEEFRAAGALCVADEVGGGGGRAGRRAGRRRPACRMPWELAHAASQPQASPCCRCPSKLCYPPERLGPGPSCSPPTPQPPSPPHVPA